MAKKPIEQYDHKDKKRANNPPVGLVTPETDKTPAKRITHMTLTLTSISLGWQSRTYLI